MKRGLEEAYKCVRERLTTEHNRQKYIYDQKCHGDPYSPGDMVWLHSSVVPRGKAEKFHHPWTGPLYILIVSSRAKEGMRLEPMEKTSNVNNKGSFDRHKDSSEFNTQSQIIDDDNVGTNTPALGEDPPPENRLLT